MRLCAIKDLEDGSMLGKSIYEANGKLLLGAGFKINDNIKNKLIERKYTYVYIKEEGTEDIIPEDVISDEIKFEAKRKLANKISEIKRQVKIEKVNLPNIKELIKKGYFKKINITDVMHSIIDEILMDISANKATFAKMIMEKSEESYFLDHSLNTAVLSILIGGKYNFSKDELKSLALGTFLHDIGKIFFEQIEENKQSGKFEELYKEHPSFGYLLIKNSSGKITPMESQVVNQHHEYQDGSGFPFGLKGQNLPPLKTVPNYTKRSIYRFAEICCVVNAFENLVYNPLNEVQLSHHQALTQLIMDSVKLYNKHIIQTLIKVVPIYPIGVFIKVLNISDPFLDGYHGVVAKINKDNINKPVIVIIKDKYLRKIKPIVVDTSEFSHIALEVIM